MNSCGGLAWYMLMRLLMRGRGLTGIHQLNHCLVNRL